MRHLPVLTIATMVAFSALLIGLRAPAAAADEAGVELSAFLDGKPIALDDVSKYHCDDFSYPVIQCSVSAAVMASRGLVVDLLTSVDYVTVYDGTFLSGASMTMSQDYSVLALIGWNDRISSFRARNGETGTFFVDWFYGGSQWSFCCNTQQLSLGGYDNSFSSVERT